MKDSLNILINNYLNSATGILAIVISGRDRTIIHKTVKDNFIENRIDILYNNYMDEILGQYGLNENFIDIRIKENKKISSCSLGKLIITSFAELTTTDIELKVYSAHLAEKIEQILEGKEDVSLKIPNIIKIFSKIKNEQFPKGEHSIKVIVIGDYKSGKSSIVNRIVNDGFSEIHNPTIGLDISKKILTIDNTNIKFSIWDSGGFISQISPTKDKLFKHANAVLLLIDSSNCNNIKSIKRWYDEVKNNLHKKIPIIIVGSKNDIITDNKITEEDIESIKKQYGLSYIPVSAKNGQNIRDIFIELTHQIIDIITNFELYDTKSKYKQHYLSLNEIEALTELENYILDKSQSQFYAKNQIDLKKLREKGFPNLINVDEYSFGFKVENGNVTEISLFNSGIKELPSSLENLKSLKKLNLRCNPLNTVPEVVFKLKFLEDLDLSLTNIKEIPDSIGNLTSLKSLNLENNWLTNIPKSIGNLKALQNLNLENNPISWLPISFSNLISIKKIHLESAPFEPRGYLIKLPKDFGDLRNLELLDLSSHRLKSLPESFSNLKELKTLDLFNNKFKALPNFIGNLQSLEELNVERNQIIYLPKTIADLSNLRKFNLKNNIISPKEASDKFKAFAFKSIGKDYKRWMKIAESIEIQEDQIHIIRSDLRKKKKKIQFISPILYASIIALIGVITFLTFDITSQVSFVPLIWFLFIGALIINLLIGASIISTFSSYFKISVSKFGNIVQTHILKIFDIIVILLLIWAVRAAIITALRIELIPAINFLFEFTIPEWLLIVLILIGYNIDLTLLENIDLFLGHFYIKIFSTALVFWALYRNGLGYIKKTAFEEEMNRNIWPFLILGLFGTFTIAILNYSSLKPLLSIAYCIGVIIGACLFLWEKNIDKKSIFYFYITLIGSGILIVWLVSLWNLILSLIIGFIFIILYFLIRRYSHITSY
ncbi:MAG: GTP-binding protein [Candidatus Hermodarchaeota archaeon]